jgi:divalent metal cation (Fe/Co/Zn/Cd) transporter
MVEEFTVVVEAIPGVVDCHNVRLRRSGPYLFVDLHILLDGSLSLQKAHAITESVEDAIRHIEPNADVTVHPEPVSDKEAALGQYPLSPKEEATHGTSNLSS